jgi:hypothetical protein
MGVVMLPARRVAYTASFGDPSTSDAFVRLEQVVPLRKSFQMFSKASGRAG